jgi:hypothetical protein
MNIEENDLPAPRMLGRRGFLKGAAFVGAGTMTAGPAATMRAREIVKERLAEGKPVPMKPLGKKPACKFRRWDLVGFTWRRWATRK